MTLFIANHGYFIAHENHPLRVFMGTFMGFSLLSLEFHIYITGLFSSSEVSLLKYGGGWPTEVSTSMCNRTTQKLE